MMKVIGLTGGIASGKTVVTQHLAQLGAIVLDADLIAREVLVPGSPAFQKVVAVFGPAMLRTDGTIDRRRLGQVIFQDARARQVLEGITHPEILARIRQRLDALRATGARVVIVSAPLLVETHMTTLVDEVWVVAARRGVQLERLMARDGYSCPEAQARLDAQLSVEERNRYADRIIDNDGPLRATLAQIDQLWADLLRDGDDCEGSD